MHQILELGSFKEIVTLFWFICLYTLLSFEFLTANDYCLSYLQNRLNITKTVRKYSINKHLQTAGSEFDSGSVSHVVKHGDEADEDYGEGSLTLNSRNFDRVSHQYVKQQISYLNT